MVESVISVLYEDLEEEVLAKMPEWFKKLRKAYQEKGEII
jgi:hypothetical protein